MENRMTQWREMFVMFEFIHWQFNFVCVYCPHCTHISQWISLNLIIVHVTSHKPTSVRNRPGYIKTAAGSIHCVCLDPLSCLPIGEFLEDLVFWVKIFIAAEVNMYMSTQSICWLLGLWVAVKRKMHTSTRVLLSMGRKKTQWKEVWVHKGWTKCILIAWIISCHHW